MWNIMLQTDFAEQMNLHFSNREEEDHLICEWNSKQANQRNRSWASEMFHNIYCHRTLDGAVLL